jgi:uncharacterized membrane protein (DUF4010 family)
MTQAQMSPQSIWPYLPTLIRLGLALLLGIFVGLERERRGKDAGVRTFGFAALLGCLGSLLGQGYALLSLELLGVLIVFLNWQRIRTNETAELTTSIALLIVGFTGVLCGLGHTFTPVAVAIVTAAFLAWKEPLKGFSLGLTEEELRAAILLAILTFIIYPVLPQKPLDPWRLIEPRSAWATVILVAGIGFVNYILWKLYGTKGVELTGFLGGLVNSTVAVTELSARTAEAGDSLVGTAYRGVMLATAAMLLRNAVLLGILDAPALAYSAVPLLLMFLACMGSVFLRFGAASATDANTPTLQITSPFSLSAALKFGLLFVALDVAGTLAQRFLGPIGFYAVSFAGGLVSSASSVASAGTLAAHRHITAQSAGQGAVLAAIASVFINWPLAMRVGRQALLTKLLAQALGAVIVSGIIGMVVQVLLWPHLVWLHASLH